MHQPGENFLVPVKNAGKDYFLLRSINLPGVEGRFSMHEIKYKKRQIHPLISYLKFSCPRSAKVNIMPQDKLPCHKGKDEEHNLSECILDYVERDIGCKLPWRVALGDPGRCNDSQGFLDAFDTYKDSSDEDVYEKTGCYFKCSYTVTSNKSHYGVQSSNIWELGCSNIIQSSSSWRSTLTSWLMGCARHSPCTWHLGPYL